MGLVQGIGDRLFAPDVPVTRQDLTVILTNYADFARIELPALREYSSFLDDADIADYAKASVVRSFRSMIINGKDGNLFDPGGSATRAEFAALLKGFLERARLGDSQRVWFTHNRKM